MHARSVTITGRPEAVDEGIAFIRDEAQPAITEMDGCLGLSLVVDRVSGRCIATSAWETEDSMILADDELIPLRARLGEILGGEPEVDPWVIALMRRARLAGQGACCRIIWSRPSDVYTHVLIERFRSPWLRVIEAVDGFCSVSVFVNRYERRICSTATFESAAALAASQDAAAALRERITFETGVEFLEMAEFELALAHLRVPELV
ncbi:MAG: hypothetical protein ACRDOX_03490 [Nocardioides sp.]